MYSKAKEGSVHALEVPPYFEGHIVEEEQPAKLVVSEQASPDDIQDPS